MASRYSKTLFFLLISTLILSCAGQQVQTTESLFKPYQFKTDQYESKVDDFMVILDASSSMSERYHGQKKLKIAKDFLDAVNQTLPELKLNGALRTFGHSDSVSKQKTALFYKLTPYSSAGFQAGLQAVKLAGGTSPLASAFGAASNDLKSTQGKIAVIIVSDGKDMGNTHVVAAEKMKNQFGDRLCLYAVLVGNNPGGVKFMERIAGAGSCGFSVRADGLKTSGDMADFVKKVFLSSLLDSDGDGVYDKFDQCPNTSKGVNVYSNGCPMDTDGDGVPDYLDKCPNTPASVKVDKFGCPLDSDGDGVPDYLDKCPDTPKGASVNEKGCWAYASVTLFDFDSYKIKSEAYSMLNEAVSILKEHPEIRVDIQGHTDNVGKEAYNVKLSENRARSVKEYFVNNGIDPKRISTKGFGFARPIANNDTPEGQAQNRRVQLVPVR